MKKTIIMLTVMVAMLIGLWVHSDITCATVSTGDTVYSHVDDTCSKKDSGDLGFQDVSVLQFDAEHYDHVFQINCGTDKVMVFGVEL